MKSVLTSGDTEAIINACVTGEEAAIKNYEEALKKEWLTGSVGSILQEQLSGIKEAVNEITSKVRSTK